MGLNSLRQMDNISPASERLCKDCFSPLLGRADKKFCNDFCRSNYNNRINSDKLKSVRSINLILQKNRAILETLSTKNRTKISATKLMSRGFNLTFHTHTYKSPKGTFYFFCYEYGYVALANQQFLIIRKEIS